MSLLGAKGYHIAKKVALHFSAVVRMLDAVTHISAYSLFIVAQLGLTFGYLGLANKASRVLSADASESTFLFMYSPAALHYTLRCKIFGFHRGCSACGFITEEERREARHRLLNDAKL